MSIPHFPQLPISCKERVERERQGFEWMMGEMYNTSAFARDEKGVYLDPVWRHAWMGWLYRSRYTGKHLTKTEENDGK